LKNYKLKLQEIGLTDKEIKVILFLSLAFFIGVALKLFNGNYNEAAQFNYRDLDAKFADYSSRLDSIYSNDKENITVPIDERTSDSLIVKDLSSLVTSKQKKEALLKNKIIDLNNASKEDLMLLPGIGPKMADRIIAYRTEHGKFKDINELINVKGIGTKKFEKIKNNITVK
jgi:comEA protein